MFHIICSSTHSLLAARHIRVNELLPQYQGGLTRIPCLWQLYKGFRNVYILSLPQKFQFLVCNEKFDGILLILPNFPEILPITSSLALRMALFAIAFHNTCSYFIHCQFCFYLSKRVSTSRMLSCDKILHIPHFTKNFTKRFTKRFQLS